MQTRELFSSRAWSLLCTLLLLLTCAIIACRSILGGTDFWAHAAVGRWMVENRQVPSQSLWIWGEEPTRWIAHSWGTQVIFATLMRAGETLGPWLAIALSMACATLSIGLLWRATLKSLQRNELRPDLVLVCLFALAILCSAARFKPRPELFTALFVSAQLLFWLAWSDDGDYDKRGLSWGKCAALVGMWIVWANVHGAWAFGLALWGATLLGDGVQDRLGARWWKLCCVGIICALVTLLNPYGSAVWESLGSVRSSTFSQIEEWKRPWIWPALPPEWIMGEFILALGAFAAWTYDPRRRWAHGLWILWALYAFCQARRFLWLSALVHLAVLARSGYALQRPWWLAMRRDKRVRLALDASSLAILGSVLALQTPRDLFAMRAVSRTAPVKLTREVTRIERGFSSRGKKMRPFNDYEYSSYFQWAFAGRPPLFIDLLNAYPDSLLKDYFAVLKQDKRGQRVLGRANVVITRPAGKKEALRKFQRFLDAMPHRWKKVYNGKDGMVWVRK